MDEGGERKRTTHQQKHHAEGKNRQKPRRFYQKKKTVKTHPHPSFLPPCSRKPTNSDAKLVPEGCPSRVKAPYIRHARGSNPPPKPHRKEGPAHGTPHKQNTPTACSKPSQQPNARRTTPVVRFFQTPANRRKTSARNRPLHPRFLHPKGQDRHRARRRAA